MTSPLLPLLVAFVLAGASPAADGRGPVRDEAGLFDPAAVAQAVREIAELRQEYGWGLVIETVQEAPDSRAGWYRLLARRQVIAKLTRWAQERAEAAGVDGLFVVICTRPRVVVVLAWPPARDDDFPEADRERVRKRIGAALPKEGPDRALLAAVAEVHAILEHYRVEDRASRPSLALLLGLVAAGLVGWLILLALRAREERRAGGAARWLATPGLRAGLFGSLFGTPAALWVYDRLLRGAPRALAPQEPDLFAPPRQAPAENGAEKEWAEEPHDSARL